MKTSKRIIRNFFLLTLSFGLSFCSKDDSIPEGQQPANLSDFFAELPEWESFSPLKATVNEAVDDAVTDDTNTFIDEDPYICNSTSYSLTETPDKITTLNPDVEVLWVGSLLQGDGHLNGIGSLAEVPVRQRAPLELTLDLLTGNNNKVVENPTVSTVNQAIGELINDAELNGFKSGSNINYNNFTTYSLEQASLKMGLSASYMGASIKSSLSANISNEKRTVTAYFTQQMFTASMVLPQYPEDVFSEQFTEELFQREQESGRMSSDNPPVYVSSIVYGRIMMFSFTSTSTEAKIKSTLSAMYNGGEFSGELDTELQKVLDEAEINVVTVGGDANQAIALIRENNLGAFFTTDAPLTTAKPISYTVRNLKDNAIARVSETTTYDLRECNPIEPTGAEYTFQLTRLEIVALPDIDNSDLITQRGEFYWQLFFEDLAGPQEAAYVPYVYSATLYIPLASGEFANLTHFGDNGYTEPVIFENIPLHSDGTDYIRFHGSVWDWDEFSADEEFPIYREFRGEEDHLLLSQDDQKRQFKIRSEDAFGNIIEIFGTFQRTKILYD